MTFLLVARLALEFPPNSQNSVLQLRAMSSSAWKMASKTAAALTEINAHLSPPPHTQNRSFLALFQNSLGLGLGGKPGSSEVLCKQGKRQQTSSGTANKKYSCLWVTEAEIKTSSG